VAESPTAPSGRPLAGAIVRVHGGSGFETTTTSDSGGRFTFALEPGVYTLECARGATHSFTIGAGQTVAINCQIDAL